MSKRPFLIDGDPAKEVMSRWERQGIACELNTEGHEIIVQNLTWPGEGDALPQVPTEALDELGEHYDAIRSHLRYWRETRDIMERIHQQNNRE